MLSGSTTLARSDMTDVEARSNSTPSRSARLAVLGICVVLTGVLCVLARQLDWTRGWIYVRATFLTWRSMTFS